MPRLDERTPLQRLTGAHPGRWDEESLDHLTESSGPSEPPRPADNPDHTESRPPAWLSEPCGSVSLWHERFVPERFRGTRWDPGPRGVLVIAAIGILAILLAGYLSLREQPVSQPVPPITALSETIPAEPDAAAPGAVAVPSTPRALTTAAPAPTVTTPAPAELVVSIVGFVEHSGLRRFPPGARVADALRAATPRPEADLSTLNLAQPLTDGDQIIIARTIPRPTTQPTGSTIVNSSHPVGNSPPSSGTQRPSSPPAKVNLNTATESDLDTLPGVGPVTAKAILTWRSQHGRFTSIDQLAEIEGIGHSRLNRLRDRVTI